jgi:hypothetical protein
MSSHREAPETAMDPAADNTDVYAFVSPDKPDTVTLIANFIPFQLPDGGPNFNEFSNDVRYTIHVSNTNRTYDDLAYEFRFTTTVRTPGTFLYNTGPITALDSPNWNRYQTYTVTKITRGKRQVIAKDLQCPPCNVGERSTPNYAKLATAAVHKISGGLTVFAGQRAEGFFVDLGSIFDLGTLRPFESHHLVKSAAAVGVNGTQQLNVHSIAIQIPKKELTSDKKTPKDVMARESVIGVYATASRQEGLTIDPNTGVRTPLGTFKQVSRLGMPLINEVINSYEDKDKWNASRPYYDKNYVSGYKHPELSKLLPVLYPGVFPNLAKLTKSRTDLVAILLTGIPEGIVPGFQNYTGPRQADLLRLNMAVPPGHKKNPGGLVAGDAAGFPNGRRVFDDVVAVELRALAGATYPLVDKTYKPDAAASKLTDGTKNTNGKYLSHFPYLGHPNSGSKAVPGAAAA